MSYGYPDDDEDSFTPYGFTYGEPGYWENEARMGAQWSQEDNGTHRCNNGWLVTDVDTVVACPLCPQGQHPHDGRSPEEYEAERKAIEEYEKEEAYIKAHPEEYADFEELIEGPLTDFEDPFTN